MAAHAHSRAGDPRRHSYTGAPRTWGPWLFAGIWGVFWALLVVAGFDRFKAPDNDGRRYLLSAAQLDGVNRLRIDGEAGDEHGYSPPPRVVLAASSVVTLSVQSRYDGRRRGSRGNAQPAPRTEPPLVAEREGDTLVLRWLQRPTSPGVEPDHGNGEWIGEIVLPLRFKDLVLSEAVVEALEPVGRLSVSGRSVEMRGSVAHLDLQSTPCRRCADLGAPGVAPQEDRDDCEKRTRYGRDASLEVSAKNMQSVRLVADAGRVSLKDTERLQQLDLRLGDGVALSVDRAGVLKLARGAGEGAVAAGGCSPAATVPRTGAASSKPLDLVRMGDSPAPAQ